MNEHVVIAPVRKTVHVKAPVAHCFEVFTSGLTRWWPHTDGVGKKPIKTVLMEPKLGGRWLEISEDGTETPVATITLWEPPHRFVMLWQVNSKWQPDASMKSGQPVRARRVRNAGGEGRSLSHRADGAGLAQVAGTSGAPCLRPRAGARA